MERVDDLLPPAEAEPHAGAGKLERLERARAAVLAPPASRVTVVSTRVSATNVLNAVLSSVSKGVAADEKPALAKALLGVLDEPQLKTIVDSQGRSPRAKAVEAVLGLGYPWALSLNPEDLAFYRAQTKPAASRTRLWVVMALLAGLGAGLGASLFTLSAPAVKAQRLPAPPTRTGAVQSVAKSRLEISKAWPVQDTEAGMNVAGVPVPVGEASLERRSIVADLHRAEPGAALEKLKTCHLDTVSCSTLRVIALRMLGSDLAFQESVEEAIALEQMPASREAVEAVREASLRGGQNQAGFRAASPDWWLSPQGINASY